MKNISDKLSEDLEKYEELKEEHEKFKDLNKRLVVRVKESTINRLNADAEKAGISTNKFVVQIIRNYYKKDRIVINDKPIVYELQRLINELKRVRKESYINQKGIQSSIKELNRLLIDTKSTVIKICDKIINR